MGFYTTESRLHMPGIKCFEPDNDHNNLYISSEQDNTIADILNAFHRHFGEEAKMEDFVIAGRHIHTYAIGYDKYDPSDYTNYIHIFRK